VLEVKAIAEDESQDRVTTVTSNPTPVIGDHGHAPAAGGAEADDQDQQTEEAQAGRRGKQLSCRITLTPVAGGPAIVVRTKAIKVPKRRR
jgi:hypothetical protein